MSSDVFIISAARDTGAPIAIQQAIELARVRSSQVQDAVFGLDSAGLPDLHAIARRAGLDCPVACVVSSLRAIFFAAASMLSDDSELSLLVGLEQGASTVFVLASPEAVGRLNLLPRARIAVRSLAGPDPTLQATGLTPSDIEITKAGEKAALLLYELLDELETKPARWGMITAGDTAILVERT